MSDPCSILGAVVVRPLHLAWHIIPALRSAVVAEVVGPAIAVLPFEFGLGRATADTKCGNSNNRNFDNFRHVADECVNGHDSGFGLVCGQHATGQAPDATRNRGIVVRDP